MKRSGQCSLGGGVIQFLLLLFRALIGPVLGSASPFKINFFGLFSYFSKNCHFCRGYFCKPSGNKDIILFAIKFIKQTPNSKRREKRDMIGQDTKFTVDAWSADIIDLFLEHHLVWCHYFKRNCLSHIDTPEQVLLFLGVFQCLVKSTYHVKA